ncbi:unnamed protein product [Amoebophrya sp. A120]|nr:unnamed protein product [Amoebophrya sp. A120]|eukprot:GSA120T00000224001.1
MCRLGRSVRASSGKARPEVTTDCGTSFMYALRHGIRSGSGARALVTEPLWSLSAPRAGPKKQGLLPRLGR